jgi:hypothetical protein
MKKDKETKAKENQGEDDKFSHFSVGNSEGRSVASEKTQSIN